MGIEKAKKLGKSLIIVLKKKPREKSEIIELARLLNEFMKEMHTKAIIRIGGDKIQFMSERYFERVKDILVKDLRRIMEEPKNGMMYG